MIVDRILAAAAAKSKQRRPPKIGAWNVGRCVRQLWYTHHGYPSEPLDARALLVFDLGNRIEDAVLEWLEHSGVAHIRTNESRDTVEERETGLRVRADFFFECDLLPLLELAVGELGTVVYVPGDPLPPKPGELMVGEIKSMSDYAFQRAQRGHIDDAYLAQVEVYLRAYDCRHALVIAYRKETSHIAEVLVARDDARWALVKANLTAARARSAPARPYELEAHCRGCDGTGETEKRKLPHKACSGTGLEPGGPYLPVFPCGYCGWKTECWGALELVFHDGRPRWRVAKEAA
jgi:hypothetical protein